MLGTGIFMLFLSFKLALFTLLPALFVYIITRFISPWVKRQNLGSLQSLGGLSSEIQQSLSNFKVIVAFNRLDYFRDKFQESNEQNHTAAVKSGVASNIFLPIYTLAASIAQVLSICIGIYMIKEGNLTIGLLIGFQLYVTNFYSPLRQIAALWASFQLSLASLDRISEVFSMESDLEIISTPDTQGDSQAPILEFRDVSFYYTDGKNILDHISFALEKGKTYALVGPTGGGKTTTASLMARLYDPVSGLVMLAGRDIRTYSPQERTQKIGFILQEPFLFAGTVRENVFYGNEAYLKYSAEKLDSVLSESKLISLLSHFE